MKYLVIPLRVPFGGRVCCGHAKLGVLGLRPGVWVLGLRPIDGVACGQKSGKIRVENLRKYFRGVFVVSALFSQFNFFFGLRKKTEWAKLGENWLAARGRG